jgi:hypothetical protein
LACDALEPPGKPLLTTGADASGLPSVGSASPC